MKFEEPTAENNYKDEKAEMKRAIEIMYHNSELMKAWIRRARDLVPEDILDKIEAGNEPE